MSSEKASVSDPLMDLVRRKEQEGILAFFRNPFPESPQDQSWYTMDALWAFLLSIERWNPWKNTQDALSELIASIETKALDTSWKSAKPKPTQSPWTSQKPTNQTNRERWNNITIVSSLQKNIHSIFRDITPYIKNPNVLWRLLHAYKNYLKLDPGIKRSIAVLSRKFWLNHFDVLGLIANESNFDPQARSQAWASGLTQLMPGTKRWVEGFITNGNPNYKKVEEWFFAQLRSDREFMDIYNRWWSYKNIAIGIPYLAYLMKNNDKVTALRKYNGYSNTVENREYAGKVNAFRDGFEHFLTKNT
jgi:hypothetical protein